MTSIFKYFTKKEREKREFEKLSAWATEIFNNAPPPTEQDIAKRQEMLKSLLPLLFTKK